MTLDSHGTPALLAVASTSTAKTTAKTVTTHKPHNLLPRLDDEYAAEQVWRVHSKTSQFFGVESARMENIGWRLMRNNHLGGHPRPQSDAPKSYQLAPLHNVVQHVRPAVVRQSAVSAVRCMNCHATRSHVWHKSTNAQSLVILCGTCMDHFASQNQVASLPRTTHDAS